MKIISVRIDSPPKIYIAKKDDDDQEAVLVERVEDKNVSKVDITI